MLLHSFARARQQPRNTSEAKTDEEKKRKEKKRPGRSRSRKKKATVYRKRRTKIDAHNAMGHGLGDGN